MPFPRLTSSQWRVAVLTVLLVLNLLDAGITHWVLAHGGMEGNFVSEWIIDHGLLWPIKVGLPALVLLLAWRSPDRPTPFRWVFTSIVVALYLGVVGWNISRLVLQLQG